MSPGTKEVNKDDDSLPKVFGDDRKYRSIVATINFMATDMPDLQFACKEACREMSAPTVQSWKKIKRIGRYLFGLREGWSGSSPGRMVTAAGRFSLTAIGPATWRHGNQLVEASSCWESIA